MTFVEEHPAESLPPIDRSAADSLPPIIRQWLSRAEIDGSVLLILLTRGWQILTGPITLLLIASHFTPEMQGFHYTFYSILALQTFVELAFFNVIINVSSHEWSRLRLNSEGYIEGSQESLSRLVSLGRLVFKWYAVVSLIFAVGASTAGWMFLSHTHNSAHLHWQAPWLTLVVATSLLLWALPFNSLLEGCNQVRSINKFRLWQAVLSLLGLWLALTQGWGLWAAAVSVSVSLVCNVYFLFIRFRKFFKPFLQYSMEFTMDWKNEIWPMQWRLALLGIVHYFAYSLFTPTMFHYHGPVAAGQIGMTLQIIGGLQAMALAWVTPKIPGLGMLIASKAYKELDRVWLRISFISFLVISVGAAIGWAVIYGLNIFHHPLAGRLLAPLPAALFLMTAVLTQISHCEAIYLRAHKQEPLVVPGVINSIGIGILVVFLGSRFGPVGAGFGYLGMMAAFVVVETIIWFRCRAEWHES